MKSRKPSIPYIIWMVVFTMIPLVMIGITAFKDKQGNFSLQPMMNAFYYTDVFVKSLWIAFISTVICLLLAYPLAYLITRMKKIISEYDDYAYDDTDVDELSAKNLCMDNHFAKKRSC